MKFQEVVSGQSSKLDEHNRQIAVSANFLKDISINPNHVIEVNISPSRIIEGQGTTKHKLTRLVTSNRVLIVMGDPSVISEKIFGSTKELLKG